MDLIGERWALLIARELMTGPLRFSDLKTALPGISTSMLTTRLNDLEVYGVITRRTTPPPTPAQIYELTEWGRGLEQVLITLGQWAVQSPHLPQGKPMSAASILLSLKAMFAPSLAKGFSARLNLSCNGQAHSVWVGNSRLQLSHGHHNRPDASITGDPNLLAAIVYDGMALSEAETAGLLIEGDRSVVDRFKGLFPLPNLSTA